MRKCDLFWWLGVTQADGYLYRREGKVREVRLRVSKPSVQMLYKWRRILDAITGKSHNFLVEQMYDPRYSREYEQYLVRESSRGGIAKIYRVLAKVGLYIDSSQAPVASFGADKLAGSYLAGIIDGDGCIQLRKSYFGKRTERLIKIASATKLPMESIQKLLSSLNLSRGYISTYSGHCDLWVYVNKNTLKWCRKHLVQHLAIRRKAYKFN